MILNKSHEASRELIIVCHDLIDHSNAGQWITDTHLLIDSLREMTHIINQMIIEIADNSFVHKMRHQSPIQILLVDWTHKFQDNGSGKLVHFYVKYPA